MIGSSILDNFSTLIFGFGIVLILLLYWYSIHTHGYWKKRGVRFIKPYPLIGTSAEVFFKYLHDIDLERYQKYGRIYGHFEGSRPILSVGDPELLRQILVKDFYIFQGSRFQKFGDKMMDNMLSFSKGENWKRIRTILSPTFSTGKMKKMMNILNDCSETLLKNFKASALKNEPIDAKAIYGAFTMDVIASSAFSTKLDSHQDPDNKFVKMARQLFASGFSWRLIGFVMFPRIMRMLGETFFQKESLQFFSDLTLQIIQERKRTGQTRNDFLQLLLDTSKEFEEGKAQQPEEEEEDDITSNYTDKESKQSWFRGAVKKNLSADEVVSQCISFFLAGSDPTSTTLTFASYLLAIHPHIQEKVYNEVKSVLKESNGEITYETIQKMKYLDNVISETLRLYPPAIRTERMAEADCKLGGTGILIEKGMVVTIPVFAIHRDPHLFPEPDKFIPDRFSPNDRRFMNDTFAFMPFGGGPRICVAMRFALLEVKLCLAHVIKTFELQICSQTKDPLEFRYGYPLLYPKGVILQLKLRKEEN